MQLGAAWKNEGASAYKEDHGKKTRVFSMKIASTRQQFDVLLALQPIQPSETPAAAGVEGRTRMANWQ